MNDFKIGDLVISITDKYSVTHTQTICEVISVSGDYMCVKIVDYLDEYKGSRLIGDEWKVKQELFKHHNSLSVDLI